MNGILHTEFNVEPDINVPNYEENMKLHRSFSSFSTENQHIDVYEYFKVNTSVSFNLIVVSYRKVWTSSNSLDFSLLTGNACACLRLDKYFSVHIQKWQYQQQPQNGNRKWSSVAQTSYLNIQTQIYSN